MTDRADVVVVGAGITGAALAYWLSRTALRTIVLERHDLASGATGLNAGFLLAGIAANYADAVEVYGRDTARATWEFTRENHDLLAEALAGATVGYRRRGSWIVAADEAEAGMLRSSQVLMREDGLPGDWVESPAGLLGAGLGALSNPDDGELDSGAAVRALFGRAPGVEVRVGTEVRSLEELDAGIVIVATNAWVRDLLPEVPIRPIRAQMLATAPVGKPVADRPVYSDRGYRYWRQLEDGRLLLGGFRNEFPGESAVGYLAEPSARLQSRLDRHLRELGVAAPVERRWGGIMGFTPDQLPLLGRVPGRPGTFVSAGYSGHGMGFAFLAARLLVEHLHDGRGLPAWLSPDRPAVANATPPRQ
ncbi:MAG: gamma-glutamylputrescine oxidase [Chloroflexota bacterium]|jgi:glycine/D-amino acid oxidase-like deaminating enzyme|nr:gamma-glutamylputrescine oxidase [Chloroflexota bacterium]